MELTESSRLAGRQCSIASASLSHSEITFLLRFWCGRGALLKHDCENVHLKLYSRRRNYADADIRVSSMVLLALIVSVIVPIYVGSEYHRDSDHGLVGLKSFADGNFWTAPSASTSASTTTSSACSPPFPRLHGYYGGRQHLYPPLFLRGVFAAMLSAAMTSLTSLARNKKKGFLDSVFAASFRGVMKLMQCLGLGPLRPNATTTTGAATCASATNTSCWCSRLAADAKLQRKVIEHNFAITDCITADERLLVGDDAQGEQALRPQGAAAAHQRRRAARAPPSCRC